MAEPGRYRLGLANGVETDFAATTRAGVGTVAFPRGSTANLLFRTSNSLNGSEDADVTIDPADPHGVGLGPHRRLLRPARPTAGAATSSPPTGSTSPPTSTRPFVRTGTWVDGTVRPGTTSASGGEGYETGAARAGRGSGGYVGFDTTSERPVTMRIGLSYTSGQAAEANLAAELRPTDTVKKTAAAGRKIWNAQLRRIDVAGGTPGHADHLLHRDVPRLPAAEREQRRRRHLLAVRTSRSTGWSAGQGAQYGNFSGWDQYRAHTQLLALLEPRIAGDFVAVDAQRVAAERRGLGPLAAGQQPDPGDGR